jgi:hypothetical protein
MSNKELWALPHITIPWFEAVGPGCPVVIDYPWTLLEYVLSAQERVVTVVVFGQPELVVETENTVKKAFDSGKWCKPVEVNCMATQSGTGAWVKTKPTKANTTRSKKSNGDMIKVVITPDQLTFTTTFLVCVIQKDFSVETMATSSCMKASTFTPNTSMALIMDNLRERLNIFGTLVILAESIDDIAEVFTPRRLRREEINKLAYGTTVGAAVDMSVALEKL